MRAAAALTSRPPVDLDRAIGLWASARDACAPAGTPPPALPAAAADLQRWLEIMTTKEGGAFEAALARHARDPSLPWLVAALVRAHAGDERVEALPAQAGRVPSDSPAAATLRWQRIRLRAWGIGELDAASREPLPRWAVNEVRARGSALASSIVDWGTTAPRLPTLRSEFGDQQISYVVSGKINLVLGDKITRLGPGDVFTVPPNIPHSIQVLTPKARLVDAFTPICEEFLK